MNIFRANHLFLKMTLFVFTDGAASKNGASNCEAAWAVFFAEQDRRNCSGKIESAPSNQKAELYAIHRALQMTADEKDVTVVTDSKYSIDCLTKWHTTWERNGWVTAKGEPVKHAEIIKESLALIHPLHPSEPRVKFLHINSHRKKPNKSEQQEMILWHGNDQADHLARRVLGR